MTTFADLGVSRVVADALSARGITTPFAVQELVVADVLAGRDVLAQSPTGSGKTLAFGVPLLERLDANGPKQSGLILAPTRELASQIVDELYDVAHARALKLATVYGGVGIQKQATQARKAHVLVATPGRLEDLIQRGDVRLDRVQMLVLDEADRMLDMGFKPVMDRIVKQIPRNRQTLLFSATLEGEAGRIAQAYTTDPVTHTHTPPASTKTDIEHRFVHLAHEAKLDTLARELADEDRGRTLVFVRTKRGADRLVKRLRNQHDVEAVAMHGDKSQAQREKALARFDRGEVDVLIATDVAARGIDVRDVTHVINFDAPEDRDAYVHRTGRTGRAGATGIGVTFVVHDQRGDMVKIARSLGLSREFGDTTGSSERRNDAGRGADNPRANGNGSGGRNRNRNRARKVSA